MATEQRSGRASASEGVARFELAPPRRFMLPAILLLLSEQPGYGYGLVPRLAEFRFGHVDRPAVYRSLAQLERDGLVQVSADDRHPGQARRVYSVTPLGERVLRVWMGVIREEHAHLGEVIRRYQATATIDAVLSEVEGGWVPELDLGWWLYFDRQFSEGLGVPRPAGFGSHQETVARYSDLMGRPMRDIFYYEIFSGFRFAVVMYRLSDLVFDREDMEGDADMATDNIATQLLAKMLDLEPPT